MKKIKLLSGIVIIYCILQGALSYFFYFRYTEDLNRHLKDSRQHFSSVYQTLIGEFRQVPKTVFEGMINLPYVVSLVEEANLPSSDKDLIRKKLFTSFNGFYTDTLKPLGFRQLQFYLKDGERLLQLFEPLSFGDTLLDTDDALAKVSKERTYQEGFSVTKTYQDYRYLFPLFSKNVFIGVVELSIPLEHFSSKVAKLLHSEEEIYYTRDALTPLFSKEELSALPTSIFSKDFLRNSHPNEAIGSILTRQSPAMLQALATKLKTTNTLAHIIDDTQGTYLLHSLPVKDFKEKTVGYIISLQKNLHALRYYEEMILDNFVSALLLVLTFILYFMNKRQQTLVTSISMHKDSLEETIKERTAELTKYNSFLQSIFHAIPSPLFLKDNEGRFLKCNDFFAKLFQKKESEIIGKMTHEILDSSLADIALQADQLVLNQGSAYDYEATFPFEGEDHDFIVHKSVLTHEKEIIGIVGIMQDITRRNRYQAQLENALEANRIQQEKLAQDNHIINHYTIYTKMDTEGFITDVSDALCSISGFAANELIGQKYVRLSESPPAIIDIKKNLVENEKWYGDLACKRKDGNIYWLKTSILPQFDDTGLKTGYIAFGTDISNEMRIKGIVYLDDLTQIYNRKKLNETLHDALNVIKRYPDETTAFILFDIDDFKAVNDIHGHLIGDAVLKELSVIVSASLRDVDTFARWGGEEFAVLVPKTSLAGAIKVTEKIRTIVGTHTFKGVGHITCSFGVTELKQVDTIDSLIQRADQALYYSKDKGKNRIEILG